jgi:hypothetical protein
MPEIRRQLQKFPDFEESIKVLLIPVLNHYLNLTQLDVVHLKFRQNNRRERNLENSLALLMIKIAEIMYSNMSYKWPMTTIAKIIA